jgi:DnaJ like chaperone protein
MVSCFSFVVGLVMIFGKLIGGVIGFYSGGLFTGLLGIFVGHMFDKALKNIFRDDSPEALAIIQKNFFETTFTLIGFLAKSDGQVSTAEIKQTEALMTQMGLTADHKREAINLFKTGSAVEFDPTETLQSFHEKCGARPRLVQMLMMYLVNTALADGKFDEGEESALKTVANGLHYSEFAFAKLLKMIKAQGSFSSAGGSYYSAGGSPRSSADELSSAYDALGVSSSASDSEVKKAYRKLMSQYHPDKLMGQGVPDDMLKAATERSQEVQAAYDVIKTSRK